MKRFMKTDFSSPGKILIHHFPLRSQTYTPFSTYLPAWNLKELLLTKKIPFLYLSLLGCTSSLNVFFFSPSGLCLEPIDVPQMFYELTFILGTLAHWTWSRKPELSADMLLNVMRRFKKVSLRGSWIAESQRVGRRWKWATESFPLLSQAVEEPRPRCAVWEHPSPAGDERRA